VLRLPAPARITDEQLRSLDIPVLAILAGRSVMLDATRAAAHARKLLPNAEIEVWQDASHAINGEYPERIAAVAHRFWDSTDRDTC
jgi:pimeloyl-ACP methyl ester carboxylesterase